MQSEVFRQERLLRLHVAAVLQERLDLGPIEAIWARDRMSADQLREVARIAAEGPSLAGDAELRRLAVSTSLQPERSGV